MGNKAETCMIESATGSGVRCAERERKEKAASDTKEISSAGKHIVGFKN